MTRILKSTWTSRARWYTDGQPLDDSWMTHAACRFGQVNPPNPDDFFPHPLKCVSGTPPEVAAICNPCPVRFKCLSYALKNNEPHGIWGGLTPEARRDLKRAGAA